MCFRCLMFSLSGPCELLFLLCFITSCWTWVVLSVMLYPCILCAVCFCWCFLLLFFPKKSCMTSSKALNKADRQEHPPLNPYRVYFKCPLEIRKVTICLRITLSNMAIVTWNCSITHLIVIICVWFWHHSFSILKKMYWVIHYCLVFFSTSGQVFYAYVVNILTTSL